MCVFFQSSGSFLFNIEALKRMVRGMSTMSLNSRITLGCIWAGHALEMFSFFSFFSDCVGVYVEVLNLIWQYPFISVLSLLVYVEKN